MNGRFVLVGSLLVVSMMWPSEGAINGDGLHWSILWLVSAAFGCWQVSRSSEAALRPDQGWRNIASRLSPFVVVAGVWLSVAHVFEIQADRRSALNVSFEWSAILAASVLFWQWPAAVFRQYCGRLMIGLTLGFAIMGIVQHHVVWEQRADWYLERMAAIENWEQTGSGAAAAKQAEGELVAEQVPLTGSAADTFRRRLLDSSEAIGPFALANTLGGFLAAGLVLLVGMMSLAVSAVQPAPLVGKLNFEDVAASKITANSKSKRMWNTTTFFLPVVWALLIGYALILTKSRTAWVATAVGILLVLNSVRRNRDSLAVIGRQAGDDAKSQSLVGQSTVSAARKSNALFGKAILAVSLVASGLIVVGVASGAIDREVLLESPRSLRFRLMYWMGTSDLLVDNAVLGTGPGNFRNTYLQYKLADSSEQILDPHNLPLDTYCSAGLLGLIGLLLFVGTPFLGRVRKGVARQTVDQEAEQQAVRPVECRGSVFNSRMLLAVAGCAFVLFVAWEWFNGADLLSEFLRLPDGRFLVLVIPAGVVLLAMTMVKNWQVDRVVFRSAFVALLVHLLGAGAFQITAVGLILMCLHRGSCDCLSSVAEHQTTGGSRKIDRQFRWGAMWNWSGLLVFGLLAVVVVVVGLIPARAAERALGASRQAQASGKRGSAVSIVDDGILADQFDVKLRQQKAELLTYSLIAEIAVRDDSAQNLGIIQQGTQQVLAACDDWEGADLTGHRPFVLRSRVWESLWHLQGQKDQLHSAIAEMKRAVERYPTNVESLSRLAMLQNDAGLNHEALAMAENALQQEKINRTWGHAELYLDSDVLEQLNQIVNSKW
ncbi:MAG: O-antigen ligase family protein [Fuerstiella sp.]